MKEWASKHIPLAGKSKKEGKRNIWQLGSQRNTKAKGENLGPCKTKENHII